MLSGAVEIRGDSELGQRFQAILNAIDVDWEEQLSKVTGDVVAHQLGNMARGVNQWLTETADSVAQDVGEYLQEESRDLPHPSQVAQFVADVDQIRMDVDRLDARISRLNTALAKREP
ncbi:MAG: hypothetical protein GXP10_07015 [Gammaproteobacteria bacterium]|nr:hypothetical protein [Gammaproteobacteria bacterium]